MMDIYYENSIGERLNLLSPPYMLQTGEFFDYKWMYGAKGKKISSFEKEIEDRIALLSILNYGKESYYEAINHFAEVTEKDVLQEQPGRLYIGDMYLRCYITASKKTEWENGIELLDNEITITTDHPFWCKETTIQFLPGNMDSDSRQQTPVVTGETFSGKNLDNKAVIGEFSFDFLRKSNRKVRYPQFDLPFDFSKTYGKRVINNTGAFSESDFILTIYGFVDTPRILIAGHPYVVNAIVYEGECVVIDSAAGTVKKIGRLGEETNLYNARGKEYSVFQKIPPGVQTIGWSGGFGFDITLFDERSEPKWSL